MNLLNILPVFFPAALLALEPPVLEITDAYESELRRLFSSNGEAYLML